MLLTVLRKISNNLGTLVLAFMLALAVWISAVLAANPNEECNAPRGSSLEIVGKKDDLVLVGSLPAVVDFRLRAPQSICEQLDADPEFVTAFLDLSGLGAGTHLSAVQVDSVLGPVRVIEKNPSEISISLEQLTTKQMMISAVLKGEPALGFQTGPLTMDQRIVDISGSQSLVNAVAQVVAEIDISDASELITGVVALSAIDKNGVVVQGITLEPASVEISQPVTLSERYRVVSVTAEIVGLPATGYRMTNISVFPSTVTLFSEDPEVMDSLPGFVKTQPLDITDLKDNLEVRVGLDLPPDVKVVGGQQNVLVQVGIAAIESSDSVSIMVEVIGLGPGLNAQVSPEFVNIILSGPLPVLESLAPEDVRVFVDLTGLGVGTHTLELVVEILPDGLQAESINPATVEVVITVQLTPMITPSVPAIPTNESN
ncbi:MAG: CdaR family protein [Anaerolineae bacterium]|nr:CdaR family protein [Anaerolineae bacterium]